MPMNSDLIEHIRTKGRSHISLSIRSNLKKIIPTLKGLMMSSPDYYSE